MSLSEEKRYKQEVEAWLKWTLGLLERRNSVLSKKTPAGQLNEMVELTEERVRQKELLPPLPDVWIAEGMLVWSDRIENLSIMFVDYSCFPNAKEFGLALLDLFEGLDFSMVARKDEIAKRVDNQLSEAMGMMQEGKRKFGNELTQGVEDKIHDYLRDKGLPRSAPLPREITLQIMNEVKDELLERVSDKTLREIDGIYDKLWEIVKARRSEASVMLTRIMMEYGIDRKRVGLD